jgi:CxxC motif-containing protein
MSQELTCITCPMGCRLVAERGGEGGQALSVTGNRCPRGAAYAREELLAPKRTVTATCRSLAGGASGSARRIPCRTTAPFPRERVDELLAAIYALEEPLPVRRGRVLIRDALGLGIDVVATRTLG